MTLATLEITELTDHDFAAGCQSYLKRPCANAATHVVRYICGCIRLMCQHCVDNYLAYLRSNIGRPGWCPGCGTRTFMAKISDIVVSIDRL